MKISIITINLNNGDGLKRTIESVISQTKFDIIEYIIIDGGSTDNSVEIIKKYSNSVTTWVSEKDNGLYDAMNKGVEKSTGDYCLFLNSGDNLVSNNVIEKILPFLDKDIVYGDLLINNKFKKTYPNDPSLNYFYKDTLPHPSSFIKRELISKLKYNINYSIISDWIFFKESIIDEKCTYKHVGIVVSNFWLGGISKDERKIKIEKETYFNSLDKYDNEICVIIPCYNQGKYIKETIDSLKASTYNNFHCVIVNDGSTDNSEEVIFENINNDKRFDYYKNENHGLAYSRNFGISKSNSKYILCLDSDDKISPTYIENGIKYLNEHYDTSIYYGKAKMFFDDGTEKDWNLQQFRYKTLLKHNLIYCSFIYRRKDYNERGGYDENMTGYEDWEFLIRLLYDNDKVYRTDDVVFFYRRHKDSMDFKEKQNFKKHKEYIVNKNKKIFEISGKSELDIFICAEDNVKVPQTNDTYKIVKSSKINNGTWNGIKGEFYSEIMSYFWIADNYPLKDYVGFCHYGKYWSFMDKIPDIDTVFSKYEIIAAKQIKFKWTIKEHYKICHNIEDLYIVSGILAEKYPEYVVAWNKFLNGNLLFPYNMFIMKREEFLEYAKFMRTILDEYVNVIGKDVENRIKNNKEKYIKKFSPNSEEWYQYRIGGYLAERLTNAWIIKNHKSIGVASVTITENKYKKDNPSTGK